MALAAILLFLGGLFYFSVTEECTVGVTGTAATLSIRGYSAKTSCDQWLRNSTVATYTLTHGTPATPIICQYVIGRRFGADTTATVRDEGSLKIVGNTMCDSLRKVAVR